jgi:protein arginine kinase activator
MLNGKKIDMHLCPECAAKKGLMLFTNDKQFSIPNFLGSFLGSEFNLKDMQTMANPKTCNNCGMSFADIRQTGKLGCSECYEAFDSELEPTLRRIHGNSKHLGKIPLRGGERVFLKKEMDELKLELQKAIREESYEQAAEIRDKIKELEKVINEEGSR